MDVAPLGKGPDSECKRKGVQIRPGFVQINNEQALDISMYHHHQIISDDRGHQGTAGEVCTELFYVIFSAVIQM